MDAEQIASIATALGVIVAAWQLRLGQKQAKISFEDSLACEYRKLAERLPTEALLGGELSEKDQEAALDSFYHYFDLCNSQIFLRQQGRVTRKTWLFWSDGIRTNLSRPAFYKAWVKISARTDSDFSELRRSLAEEFNIDPKRWGK